MTLSDDTRWMRRALQLAAKGRGHVSPNPMVGAVVVTRNRLVGQGYHQQVGGPHAEVHALRDAGAKARGATVHVTLEPCCHHGRTPPCTEALIAAGVKRVVAATLDPGRQVNGKGAEALRQAGLTVEVGLLEQEARELNRGYLKHVTTGLPFVSLKSAMSLDGKIATTAGESQWITGEKARAYGHRLRTEHDAILTGVDTVLADDPELTIRLAKGRDPLRVVADSRARTPPTARVIEARGVRPPSADGIVSRLIPRFARDDTQGGAIIAVTDRAPATRTRALTAAGAEVWRLPAREERVDLEALLRRLVEGGVNSVLLEAGGTLAAAALAAHLVDRLYLFIAPCLLGGAEARTPVEGPGVARLSERHCLRDLRVRKVGEDLLVVGDLERSHGR